MTYINPETYNWKDLKDDDVTIMSGYNWCIEDVEVACDNIIDSLQNEFRSSKTISKLVGEIGEKFSKELAVWLDYKQTDLTCSLMENNPERYSDDDEDDE